MIFNTLKKIILNLGQKCDHLMYFHEKNVKEVSFLLSLFKEYSLAHGLTRIPLLTCRIFIHKTKVPKMIPMQSKRESEKEWIIGREDKKENVYERRGNHSHIAVHTQLSPIAFLLKNASGARIQYGNAKHCSPWPPVDRTIPV